MSAIGSTQVRLEGPLWDGRLSAELERRLRLAMTASLVRVEASAARLTPVNTGALRASLTHQVEDERVRGPGGGGASLVRLVGHVGSPLPYALYVEQGRRRGRMPPRKAIEAWVRRKLGGKLGGAGRGQGARAGRERAIKAVTFAVQRAIGRRGTPAARMLQRALAAEDDWIQRAFRAAVAGVAGQP